MTGGAARARRYDLVVRALVCLLVLGTAACSHTTRVRTDPPGAEVYVVPDGDDDGEIEADKGPPAIFWGHTPTVVEAGYGAPWETEEYVVVHEDEAVRFKLRKGQLTTDSLSSSTLWHGATFTACGAVAAGSGVGGLVLLPVAPWAAIPAWCTAGCCGLVALGQPISWFLNMWAPPDEVFISFKEHEAETTPDGMVHDVEQTDPPMRSVPRERPPREPQPGDVIEVAY